MTKSEELLWLREKVKELAEENADLRKENEGLAGTLGDLFEEELVEKLLGVDEGLNFASPLDFAKSLIEHTTHVEEIQIETDEMDYTIPEHDRVTFDFDELEEIAEYLLVYCKHNKEKIE